MVAGRALIGALHPVRGAKFCSRDAPGFGQLVQGLLAVLGTFENPAGNMAAEVVILPLSGED